MPRRLSLLAAALVGFTASQAAFAELYVNPTLRNNVAPGTQQQGLSINNGAQSQQANAYQVAAPQQSAGMQAMQPMGMPVTQYQPQQAPAAAPGQVQAPQMMGYPMMPYGYPVAQGQAPQQMPQQMPAYPVMQAPGYPYPYPFIPVPYPVMPNMSPDQVRLAEEAPAGRKAQLVKPAGELFGKNIPIKVALKSLMPESENWKFVFQPGTENIPVSWRDASNWGEAISQFSKGSKLMVAVNENAKRIAVAYNPDMAKRLAQPDQDVWVMQKDSSLRDGLEQWAAHAGWTIDWGDVEIDYPIDHTATLIGKFDGQGGVVDRVLKASARRSVPLTARFYRGNNVVVISESGYKPETATSPMKNNELY